MMALQCCAAALIFEIGRNMSKSLKKILLAITGASLTALGQTAACDKVVECGQSLIETQARNAPNLDESRPAAGPKSLLKMMEQQCKEIEDLKVRLEQKDLQNAREDSGEDKTEIQKDDRAGALRNSMQQGLHYLDEIYLPSTPS